MLSCKRCAECCIKSFNIGITEEEVKRISEFLNIDPEIFYEPTKNIQISGTIKKKNNEPCPFLKGKDCSIYEIRPANCKDYYCSLGKAW